MRILRIGTDIIKVARVARVMQKYGDFPSRILSPEELGRYKQGYGYIARRWAGKESVAKAIGTGFRDNCSFKEISILNDDLGRPHVEFNGITKEYVQKMFPGCEIQISLSDDEYAVAYCILVSNQTNEAQSIA